MRSLSQTLLAPFAAYLRWARRQQTKRGKALAYGGPVVAIYLVGVIILSVVRLSNDGASEVCAATQVDPDCVEEGSSSNGSGPDGELTLVVSPFETDTMLFALLGEDGTRIEFEGTRNPDGTVASVDRMVVTQGSLEATFHAGLKFDLQDFAARTAAALDPANFAIDYMSVVDKASDLSFAARIFYRPDVVTVQAMAPITTGTFIESESADLIVSDIPELARFMAESGSTSNPLTVPARSVDEQNLRAYVRVGGVGYMTGSGVDAAAATPPAPPTNLKITSTVRSRDGGPPASSDPADLTVYWQLYAPLHFLRDPASVPTRYGAMQLVEATGNLRTYEASVPLTRPLTGAQIARGCAEAVDNMGKWGTGIGVVDVILDAAGYLISGPIASKALKVLGTGLGLSGLGTALSSGSAVDCVVQGEQRTEALDADWSVSSMIAEVKVGRSWSLPGQRMCGYHPDVAEESARIPFKGTDLLTRTEIVTETEILLPQLLEARIIGPDEHPVSEEVTFSAQGVGGTGPYEFDWDYVEKGPSVRRSYPVALPYELVLAVRDSTLDTACQSKTIEVTDATPSAATEPPSTGPRRETIHLRGGVAFSAAQEQELAAQGSHIEGSSMDLTFSPNGGPVTGMFSITLLQEGIDTVTDVSALTAAERALLQTALENGSCSVRAQNSGTVTGAFDPTSSRVEGSVNTTVQLTYIGCGSAEIDRKFGSTLTDSFVLSATFVNGSVTGTLSRGGSSLPFEAHQFEE